MLNLFVKLIYIFFLIVTSTFFVYYIKLYAETNKIKNLALSLVNAGSLLFFAYKLFQNHNVPLIMMTMFIKVIPILLLTLIDTFIFKTKMTFNKGLGIFIVIVGIIFMEM
jgi:uncharacterized membrane protein